MNRTAHLRSLITATAAIETADAWNAIHCTGPYAYFGQDGQVSYTAYTHFTDEQKQAICTKIAAERDDVVHAYITRRIANGTMGGNIKVIYCTRANGSSAY